MLAKKMDCKGKKNNDLLKLASIWSIAKPLQGGVKSVFESCAKFTGESVCWSQPVSLTGTSTANLLKRDSIAGLLLGILRDF